MTIQNHDLSRIQASDARHHIHPFCSTGETADADAIRVITHANGSYIYDANGHAILDGMAGLWCVNVGYGRKELVDAANRQMEQLAYYTTFFRSTSPPATALAEKISALTNDRLPHVFFTNSGSEANDTVLRLARYYWALQGKPEKDVFITRLNAYHGSTVAGASLGGLLKMHEIGSLPIPGISHVAPPYTFMAGPDVDAESFGIAMANEVENRILEIGPDRVGCFMAEPVQGSGGVIVPPASYFTRVQEICRKYNVLIAADEVICGFGRLGQWFGHQHFGFEPDIVSMAKGLSSGYLPIAAVALNNRIHTVLDSSSERLRHGFTYSGHPVAAAVALRNIQILEDEDLIARTREETGPYLTKILQTLADHPIVGEVRNVGLLGAIELVSDRATRGRFQPKATAGGVCQDFCWEEGLSSRGIGDVMAICPPLTVSIAELDELGIKMRRALDKTQAFFFR